MRKFVQLLFAAVSLVNLRSFADLRCGQVANGQRPCQFVALAFDGSKSLNFWQRSLDFAKETSNRIGPVRFSYFISGVYFLTESNKQTYVDPRDSTQAGRSAIGFGGTADELVGRIQYVDRALAESHEIASHANGHFDGASWNAAQWRLESAQFNRFIVNVFSINNLVNEVFTTNWIRDWAQHFDRRFNGFRAPLLANNPSMRQVLKEFGFTYDTSQVADRNLWPRKTGEGLWQFPLAPLTIAGTAKRTLSMDYNFYMAQSNAQNAGNPELYAQYEEQMVQTYLKYFKDSYEGNRSPINIGHHFSLWNGGAYWRAMKRFAEAVCGLPEVVCGTYRELENYLESVPASQLAQFERGAFPKVQTPPIEIQLRSFAVSPSVSTVNPQFDTLKLVGPDVDEFSRAVSAIEIEVGPFSQRVVLDDQDIGSRSTVLENLSQSGANKLLRMATRFGSALSGSTKYFGKNGEELLSVPYNYSIDGDKAQMTISPSFDRPLAFDCSEAH